MGADPLDSLLIEKQGVQLGFYQIAVSAGNRDKKGRKGSINLHVRAVHGRKKMGLTSFDSSESDQKSKYTDIFIAAFIDQDRPNITRSDTTQHMACILLT